MPLAQLLNCEVTIKDCTLTNDQMVAHILWEITFYGFDNDSVKEQGEKLKDSVDDLDELLAKLPENPTDEDYEAIGLHLFKIEDFE